MENAVVKCMGVEEAQHFTTLLDEIVQWINGVGFIVHAEVESVFWKWNGVEFCIAALPATF